MSSEENNPRSGTYVTARGVTLHFKGIAGFARTLSAEFKPPDPPYYEIKLATGGIERHVHDETTVKTPEEIKALADYEAQCAQIEVERNQKLLQAALIDGILFDYPEDDTWIKKEKFLGVKDIPTDPFELRLHYINNEVIGSLDDYAAILAGVQEMSGIPEEKLDSAEAAFPRKVRRARREDDNRSSGDAPAGQVVV